MSGTELASAVHDPDGRLVPAIVEHAGALKRLFSGFALNVSDRTAEATIDAAQDHLDARIIRHQANEAMIGRVRREAVALARPADSILYCDPDHLIRWVERDPDGLAEVLATKPEADLLVVGRSEAAMASMPRRLRDTEQPVNEAFRLLTGLDWDLLYAIRRLGPRAADLIVSASEEDTLANDVEWPLLARRGGLTLCYATSDALAYRTIEEFGAPADTGDLSPLQWIRRMEFAGLMASAMRRFL